MELIQYLKANYVDVRVIGVINPSVIVTLNNTSYTLYMANGQNKAKYVVCKGQERFYFDKLIEIKKFIK